jgi:cell division control protein 6
MFNSIYKKKEIIKNSEILSVKYFPKKIIGRIDVLKDIVFYLSYFFREHPYLPKLLIFGGTGTGKTLIINYVLDEFQKECEKVTKPIKIIKIRCSEFNTKYSILKKIYEELSSEKAVKEKAFVYDDLIELLSTKHFNLFLFIDEIHSVREAEFNSLFYTISRIEEDIGFYKSKIQKSLNPSNKGSSKIGYILVSNNINIHSKLQPDTKSSLTKTTIYFNRYTVQELKEILKSRIDEGALYLNTYDEGILEQIASFSFRENEDARYSLLLLALASQEAEKKGLNKITSEIVVNANNILKKNLRIDTMRDLPALYQNILFVIYASYKAKKEITSSTLFSSYLTGKQTFGTENLSQSRISQVISELENLGIITTSYLRQKGKKNRRINVDETIEAIEIVLKEKGYI